MSLNSVQLIGHLGKDPELKQTSKGTSYAQLSIATSEMSNKAGDKHLFTEWHNVIVWAKNAENACRFLKKGSQVFIQGRLNHQCYDKDGEKRYFTQVVAQKILFLGSKGKGDNRKGEQEMPQKHDSNIPEAPGMEIDDIPF